MHIQETLENLGLSKAETDIYLAALELGESLPKHLAKKANVKRPTLYKILPDLLKKGLLSETIKGKRRLLVAEDPGAYVEKKQVELEQMQRLMPELRLLLATASVKPKIIFYEGAAGLKKFYADNLRMGKPILEAVGMEKISPEIEKYIANYYIPERIKRKIPIKIIVSGAAKYGSINLISGADYLREVKTIAAEKFPIPLNFTVYGDNAAFGLYRSDSEPIAVIIRSKEIATTMRSMFNFIWEKV